MTKAMTSSRVRKSPGIQAAELGALFICFCNMGRVTQLFCSLLHSFTYRFIRCGSALQAKRKMNKETKIPFFTSLTNSSLVKRLTQENLKTHASFAGKQHQTSYRKEKTEITILSQETTNIKEYLKKKLKSQSSHRKQPT